MRIRARDHEGIHAMMLGRGLPRALLRAEGEVVPSDLTACLHPDTRPIAPVRQHADLRHTMTRLHSCDVHVVGTRRDPDLISLVGLEFFARATQAFLENPSANARPWWHTVVGGWSDRMRDDDARSIRWREEAVGRIGVLVLSGVTVDCPADKLEKVRDLLTVHEGTTRMVLVTGGDPWQFSLDRLNRRPERVTFLNRKSERATRNQG